MNPRFALLLIPVGFGMVIVGASTVFAMKDVAVLTLHTAQGTSPPMDLSAGQLYGFQLNGDCEEGAHYSATFDIVDASTGAVSFRWSADVTDRSRGCGLISGSGEVQVPRTGSYAIRWDAPPALIAKNPRVVFHEIPMFLGENIAYFVLAGFAVALSAPFIQGGLRLLEDVGPGKSRPPPPPAESPLHVARLVDPAPSKLDAALGPPSGERPK